MMPARQRAVIATLQLRALAMLGWSVHDLAEQLHWSLAAVSGLRNGEVSWISHARADQLWHLYYRLHAQRRGNAHDRFVIGRARARGWEGAAELLSMMPYTR